MLGVLPFFWIAWILGIIAIVFGVLARNRFGADPAIGRKGMATAGLVLGILTIVACIIWVLVIAFVIDTTGDFWYCIDHPDSARCD